MVMEKIYSETTLLADDLTNKLVQFFDYSANNFSQLVTNPGKFIGETLQTNNPFNYLETNKSSSNKPLKKSTRSK